jgi:uncharacterized iron-regulated protein
MTCFLFLWALLTGQAPQPSPQPAYVPERVYDTRRQAFSDFESMLADLSRADVIVVGEQHDDPNTHRLETAILDGLRRRGVSPAVSLEMFERDTQGTLDAYLAGKIPEEELLKGSRPWPRYTTDYRPLVEMARTQSWPVIAANVPRKYASDVAKSGPGALVSLTEPDRSWVAKDVQCPKDSYYDRFAESMTSHPFPGFEKLSPDERKATIDRYYYSQCVKDETMAETVADAVDRGRKPVVQFNGAFHSDFAQGTAERIQRRLPGRRVAVISILPVKDLDAIAPSSEDLKRAEYLVYTQAR